MKLFFCFRSWEAKLRPAPISSPSAQFPRHQAATEKMRPCDRVPGHKGQKEGRRLPVVRHLCSTLICHAIHPMHHFVPCRSKLGMTAKLRSRGGVPRLLRAGSADCGSREDSPVAGQLHRFALSVLDAPRPCRLSHGAVAVGPCFRGLAPGLLDSGRLVRSDKLLVIGEK